MKRRGVLLLASIVVMVVVGAGVALAANINCGDNPAVGCLGTNQPDTITGTADRDVITAASSGDTVRARGDGDDVYGDAGGDNLNGNRGGDYIEGGRGEDVMRGGPDNDAINAVDGLGGDVANGGDGDDDCYLDNREAVDPSDAGTFPSQLGNDVAVNCENIFVLDQVTDTSPPPAP
jgi:Ca2+-binding RTX toxin-like protein